MKKQRTSKKILAFVLTAVFLLTALVPASVFAEAGETGTVPTGEVLTGDTPAADDPAPAEGDADPEESDPAPVEGDSDPEEGDADPEEGDADPEADDPAPVEGDSDPEEGDADPEEGDADPEADDPAPVEGDADPVEGDADPEESDPAPVEGDSDPEEGDADPEEGDADPEEGDADPEEGDADPEADDPAPVEGDADPEEGDADPEEGDADPEEGDADPEEGDADPEADDPAPVEGDADPVEGDADPEEDDPDPAEGDADPVEGDADPEESDPAPLEGDADPEESDADPEEGDPAPVEGDADPEEGDADPEEGDPAPAEGDADPEEGDAAPEEDDPAPVEGDADPEEGDADPEEDDPAPVEGDADPEEGDADPEEDDPAPAEGDADPEEGDADPEEGDPAPAEGDADPIEGEADPEEDDAAPADDDPAPVENDPAPADDDPAPAENDPVPVEDTPAPVEDVPAEVETAPAESDPIPEENEPAPVEAAPAPVEAAPAPVEDIPAPVEDVPAEVETAPAESDPIPEENEPAPVEAAPAPVEVVPAPVEDIPAPVEDVPAEVETAPAESDPIPEENEPAPVEAAPAPVEAAPAPVEAAPAEPVIHVIEVPVDGYIFTVSGTFPEGTEIQVVEIPRDAAAMMAGKAPLFAYDFRLVVDGQVWQPEDYGTDVQVSVRSQSGDLDDVVVDLLHVRTNLLDDAGNLSEAALQETIRGMKDGTADSEAIETSAVESGFSFGTSSFSPYVGTTNSRIVYIYNATLFNEDSANYPGVYTTKLKKNEATAEEAKTSQTIGIESIADGNLENAPTTESPAIIQGAAVGYEERVSPTEYNLIDPNRPRPEPYSEFTVKILEEQGADGTIHKKPSGFDGTYVIVRLDVSDFLSPGSDNLYLHMEQKDNKALMPAATMAKGAPNAKPEDYTPDHVFTDGLGNRSAAYRMSDLLDPSGTTPYVDVIVFATAANVAGADTTAAAQGDIPLAFYVDDQKQYNDALVEYDPSSLDPNDPNAATEYDKSWHAKFFDAARAGAGTATAVSRYLVKGSDLALETMVEKSGGADGSETTYWSLKKSMEHTYYDREIDKDPNDAGSGVTAKLMSEVAVTNGLALEGTAADSLRKRTLDVNSYDIQVANNAGVDGGSAEDITLKNAWLTIADYSNTTGAEMAIGNNAQFVIDQGGKLIIDQTCQLEVEWDGATTTPGTAPSPQPEILNNGQLDLRAGGEIVNNGIITIEGTEGKPLQPETSQQASESEKGHGEMTIREGATVTNNGALVVYGTLTNRGTLVNNGRYNDVIKSNDPDKGAFDYHKGIQVAWKDDVTQKNIEAGSLTNEVGATLMNNGDIVLTPGTLENKGEFINHTRAHLYSATATEAIIPITPDPATPTVVTKRVKLDPVKLSNIINSGTMLNYGVIAPATVSLLDNTGAFDKLTTPGDNPELFRINNTGTLRNYGYAYRMSSEPFLVAVLAGSVLTDNDLWLYLYDDASFRMMLPNSEELRGTYEFINGQMVFTFGEGMTTAEPVVEPKVDEDGNYCYSFTAASGFEVEFLITREAVDGVLAELAKLNM